MKNEDLEVLWVEIESDLEDIRTIVDEVETLRVDLQSSEEMPTQRDKAALGSFLHSFYNGMENILKRISREVDGVYHRAKAGIELCLKGWSERSQIEDHPFYRKRQQMI